MSRSLMSQLNDPNGAYQRLKALNRKNEKESTPELLDFNFVAFPSDDLAHSFLADDTQKDGK